MDLIERPGPASDVSVSMRLIKYTLVLCAAAVLAGCATYEERDAQGRPYAEYETYHGDAVVDGLSRGVNTNWFGPVYSGAEAARGVGTGSGTYDQGLR